MRSRILPLSAFIVALFAAAASATTVWSGPLTTFTKPAGADWTLPVNQDRITTDVWITRGSLQGIFNIAQESGYTHNSSPLGTQRATGSSASGYASLTFTDWETWAAGHPRRGCGEQ